MTLKEYQKLSTRTCNDLGSLESNLSHMVLGIISEREEFLYAMENRDFVNAKEEIADKMFYIANYCTFRGFDLEEVCGNVNIPPKGLSEFEAVNAWDIYSSKLADYVKKFMAYPKPLDENLEKEALKAIVWSFTLEDIDFDFDIDLQKNIDKLKVRYPQKFSTDSSLNRDLDKELEILEKDYKYEV